MSPNTLYLIIAIAACVYAVATTVGLICLNRRQNKTHQDLSQQKKALKDLKDSLDGSAVDDIIRFRDEAERHKNETAAILNVARELKEKLEDLVQRAQRRLAELENSNIIRLLDRANELLETLNRWIGGLDRRVQDLRSDVDDLKREDIHSDWKDMEQDGLLKKHQKEIAELQSKAGSSGAKEGSSGARNG